MTAEREALLYATGYADGQRHILEQLDEQRHQLSNRVDALQREAGEREQVVFSLSAAGAAKAYRQEQQQRNIDRRGEGRADRGEVAAVKVSRRNA